MIACNCWDDGSLKLDQNSLAYLLRRTATQYSVSQIIDTGLTVLVFLFNSVVMFPHELYLFFLPSRLESISMHPSLWFLIFSTYPCCLKCPLSFMVKPSKVLKLSFSFSPWSRVFVLPVLTILATFLQVSEFLV